MKNTQVEKQCIACGTTFKVRNYRANTAKFCSHFCQNHRQYQVDKKQYTCFGCRKEFTDSPSRIKRKYCSVDCRTATAQTTTERRKNQKIAKIKTRGNNSSRVLRKFIFSIKKACCELCGYDKRIYGLDLHHIDGNPNNNIATNIAVLCALCHREVHKGDANYAAENRKVAKSN